MDFTFLSKYYVFFIAGAKNTLLLAVFTVIFGAIFGVFLALMKISRNKISSSIATAYIEFIRGTPLLVQIYIVYYGLPALGIDLFNFPIVGFLGEEFTAGIITLSINSGAYVAEIIRSGIQAVDKGQMEAARSLGMSYSMAMRYIIIPQAFKNILPALGNELIVLIKESSIVSVIGVHELMYKTGAVRGITYRGIEPYIVAALFYFVMTFTLSKLLSTVERRMKVSD